MRIAYCILGTFNSGGMERVLANKVNYLSARGHEVVIITTDQQQRPPYFPLNGAVCCYDLEVDYTGHQRLGLIKKTFSYFQKQRLHKKRLTELLKDLEADIVISMFDNDVSFLYKINDGSKKVLEIHFSRYKRLQYGRKGLWHIIDVFRSWQDKHIASRYHQFVVLTEEDKAYWGDLKNMMVIPNANTFAPKTVASLRSKRTIAVGRYDYQKGFDDLIKVWKMVHDHHGDSMLTIYGHGPLHDHLTRLIEESGLTGAVHLHEPTNRIEEAYLDSSLAVMTSRYEGLPMALLEAQACGLPMVSYTCKCGPKDIIQDGVNGFLVAEGDKKMMAKRIIRLLENEHLRHQMGTKAKEMSVSFSEEKVMGQWLDLLNSLTK